jgi:hypothetical protein
MKHWKCLAGFFLLSLLLLSTTTCKELFPGVCEKVYFRDESPQDDVVMVPDCVGSYEQSNIKYDSKFNILSYNFSVTCDGKTYTGSVTFTRDSSGVLTSRMLIVNGKDCS